MKTSTTTSNASLLNRAIGMLVGLAVGDAVGTTLEFKPRGTFEPITDMVGGGCFNLIAGQWTDDTSMALCLGESLLQKQRFDPNDQMARYCNWYQYGYMSATNECFDVGATIRAALDRFLEDGNPYAGSTDPYSAGNGSIMRLAPIVLAYWNRDADVLATYAKQSSQTTHAAPEAMETCAVFATALSTAIHCSDKNDLIQSTTALSNLPRVAAIQRGDYQTKSEADIRGSGYVIESLEAALWCFQHTDNFTDAILKAANLGDDADTTAAVCGQIAGAYYGYNAIPKTWLAKLFWHDKIYKMAEQLFLTDFE